MCVWPTHTRLHCESETNVQLVEFGPKFGGRYFVFRSAWAMSPSSHPAGSLWPLPLWTPATELSTHHTYQRPHDGRGFRHMKIGHKATCGLRHWSPQTPGQLETSQRLWSIDRGCGGLTTIVEILSTTIRLPTTRCPCHTLPNQAKLTFADI